MNKAAIKNFAVWARNKLIADIEYKAGLIGITEKGIAPALPQSTKEVQFFDIGTRDYATVRGEEIRQRNAFVAAIREKEREVGYADAFQFVVEKVAYTWFNRLIAIRFMEVNDYLPSRVRVLSSDLPNKTEPDMVTKPFDLDLDYSAADKDEIMRLKDENQLDELFRKLFLMQCYKLNEILPRLFDKDPRKTSDQSRSYMDLLLTISFTDQDGVVCHLVKDIREQDFRILTEEDLERQKIENIPDEEMPAGQVAIIGWMYQYYNTELNALVYDGSMSKSRVPKSLLPAATTIYTPDWPIRYMVENSLGRMWVEGHPDEKLIRGWRYYLEEAKQEPDVQARLAEIRKEYATLRPEEIKVIDPCMGSGHILVYLFDVLMQIYDSQGWTKREAVRSILENNLYGQDIDERAAQLAYFAVMMKARQYDRRFLSRGMEPHVYEIQESGYTDSKGRAVHHITEDLIDYFANGSKALKRDMAAIGEDLFDAKEYGSLLNVRMVDFPSLYARFEEIREDISLYQMPALEILLPLVRQAEVMAQKYHAVVTNPPYLGSARFSPILDQYIKKYYSDVKADLSMVMYKHAIESMVKVNGFVSFITTSSWMFLSSFQKLRLFASKRVSLTSIVDFGTELFEGKVGHNPISSWVVRGSIIHNYKMTAIRLVDYCYSRRDEKEPEFFKSRNRYYVCKDNYEKIPGSPVAYWVSQSAASAFQNAPRISELGASRSGMQTGNNDLFLRFWFEVCFNKIGFSIRNDAELIERKTKWVPQPKGGPRRKWYGNLEYVVNFEDSGRELRAYSGTSIIKNPQYYYRTGITWSHTTSSSFASRYLPEGCIFNVEAPTFYPNTTSHIYYYLGCMNSNVIDLLFGYISQTMHYMAGDMAKMPVFVNNQLLSTVTNLVKENITLSRTDWDSFETSWDFQRHPLIRGCSTVEAAFRAWEAECNDRFNKLKANEEELNRIFIDIYDMQDELTPEVEDKDVTVRKADLQRDMKSLISYAVGCMFGRYSLDVDGLAYGGGQWEAGKYSTFLPDPDNCIPLTDEAYFEDDIVGRFVEFIRVVYGADTLNENLAFIAKALGNKGNSSREVIRNYFLKDFFKDHCKIYQKRPIYWLFDSGKQNGFKALVYLHRWNADTVGNLRVEYLHRVQKVYEREIQRMQDTVDNSRNNREVNQAAKRREKLVKQLKEARDYDARIAHVALSRVDIDLDDGVKVNYQKVQQGPDGKSLGILAKI